MYLSYTDTQLRAVFDRSGGDCHLCWKKLAFANYAQFEAKGAWEVDHSVPRATGGGNNASNLLAACVSCNRSKCDRPNAVVRAANGVPNRIPPTLVAREERRTRNTLVGAGTLLALGAFVAPPVAIVGALIGGLIGNDIDPRGI